MLRYYHILNILDNYIGCCIIGQQTNVDWNALVPLVSNGNKHRCTYVHLKIFILVDVVTLLYMDVRGIWFLLFPDRENTGNFSLAQGKF